MNTPNYYQMNYNEKSKNELNLSNSTPNLFNKFYNEREN